MYAGCAEVFKSRALRAAKKRLPVRGKLDGFHRPAAHSERRNASSASFSPGPA